MTGVLGADGVTPAEWDALAERSGNVFVTREWLEAWARHEPASRLLTVVSRGPDGAARGLLPLRVDRRLPRTLRPMGPWPPPAGPLVCAPEDADAVVRDVTAQLADRGGWDVLELDAVPADEPWTDRLTGVTFAESGSGVIDLEGRTWEDLLASMSSNLRADVRRRERRLAERYSVRYRTADAASLHADVDTFLRLHWARWGESVNVFTPRRAPVLHDFAERALERGWLALWLLELDGVPVAADLNFRFAGREVSVLSGWDVEYRKDAVALALHFHAIREATADGMREFDILRGDDAYKARLAHRTTTVAHLALAGSPAGTAALNARVAGRTLGRTIRDSALNGQRRRLTAALRRDDKGDGDR